jgi:hypothetical protein
VKNKICLQNVLSFIMAVFVTEGPLVLPILLVSGYLTS